MIKRVLDRARYLARVVAGMYGSHPRRCVACGFEGRFRAAGLPPRFDAECPKCGSYERHRLFVLADQRSGLIRKDAEVLHVAPEPIIRNWVRERCKRYVTLDLLRDADIHAPLEDTKLEAESFDHVICSHVLEHVDDRRALAEILRILRPGGTLLAMVPIVEGWSATYEDDAVVSERDRDRHFGQGDHVRYYGRDFRDRVRDAGFVLEEITASGRDVADFGLYRGEKVFVATRPR
jgi:SAM-dependent methyltransferase